MFKNKLTLGHYFAIAHFDITIYNLTLAVSSLLLLLQTARKRIEEIIVFC